MDNYQLTYCDCEQRKIIFGTNFTNDLNIIICPSEQSEDSPF